jgi:hypothetical protein
MVSNIAFKNQKTLSSMIMGFGQFFGATLGGVITVSGYYVFSVFDFFFHL